MVTALQTAGHQTLVIIPDKPLSWIGKAHAVGQSLTVDRICPYEWSKTTQCPRSNGETACSRHSWYVVNGSPASSTQVGLFHLEWAFEDIDLVLSGPNHGRNASTIYNLSSGTVGGALEGALCGKRSISLSFGSKDPQPSTIIEAACRRAVHLVESLCARWNPDVELYNINIPMVVSVGSCPAVYTVPCRSYWSKGSLFEEQHPEPGYPGSDKSIPLPIGTKRYFKWQPELSDIRTAAATSQEGEDLHAASNGHIS